MVTKQQARERALELGVETRDVDAVAQCLRDEGYGGLLSDDELLEIVIQAGVIGNMCDRRPRYRMARIVGVLAVLLGVTAIILDFSIDSDGSFHESGTPRRYSPRAWGITAVIIGLVLVIKPSTGTSEVT